MFRDIHDELNLSRGTMNGISFTELLYADDTARITNNVNAMNRLIAKIEEHAHYYGLNFNKTKCVAMCYNSDGKPSFPGGEFVTQAQETIYLGSTVSSTHNTRKEVCSKLSSCFAVMNKLNVFWSKSNCPPKFKIQVFDAVVRSKLVYGLEATQLPKYLLNKLDSFQLKGLRKILKLDTTFINRSNTNQKVFQESSRLRNPDCVPGKDVQPFSTYVRNKQQSLYKHIVRLTDDDPLRQSTLEPSSSVPCIITNKRVGRPRGKWAWDVIESLYLDSGTGTKASFKLDPVSACIAMEPRIRRREL